MLNEDGSEDNKIKKRRKKRPVYSTIRKTKHQNHSVLSTSHTECVFCKQNDNEKLGTFFTSTEQNIAAHQFCLLFSAGLPQNGGDDEGFDGFLFPDVLKEANRAQKLPCKFCNQIGASSGCTIKFCRQTYHVQCGFQHGVQFQFMGKFNTYCTSHRSYQDVSFLQNASQPSSLICPLCLDSIATDATTSDVLKMPCCRNKFAHKECIQRQASSSGYFFKCPYCNNEKEFQDEMAKYGVYIPQRDAAWEEPNAFADLLQQYNKCDWPQCKCIWGRKFTDDEKWKFLRCYHCGQSAVHKKCLGSFLLPNFEYICPVCNDVIGANSTTTVISRCEEREVEHQRRLKELKSRDDPLLLSHPTIGLDILRKKHGIIVSYVNIERLPNIILNNMKKGAKINVKKYADLIGHTTQKKNLFDNKRPGNEDNKTEFLGHPSHHSEACTNAERIKYDHIQSPTTRALDSDLKIQFVDDSHTQSRKDVLSSTPPPSSIVHNSTFTELSTVTTMTQNSLITSKTARKRSSGMTDSINSKRPKLSNDTTSSNHQTKLRVKFPFHSRKGGSSLSISTNPSKSVSYTAANDEKRQLPCIASMINQMFPEDEKSNTIPADEKPALTKTSNVNIVHDEKETDADLPTGKIEIFRPKNISEYYRNSMNKSFPLKVTKRDSIKSNKIKRNTLKHNPITKNSRLDTWLSKAPTSSTPYENKTSRFLNIESSSTNTVKDFTLSPTENDLPSDEKTLPAKLNFHENDPPSDEKTLPAKLNFHENSNIVEATPQEHKSNKLKSLLTSLPPINYSQLNYESNSPEYKILDSSSEEQNKAPLFSFNLSTSF